MHRDLKPENVLIDNFEHGKVIHVKLVNYGLTSETSK